MRWMKVLLYLSAGLWLTCHLVPTVQLRKQSKKKNKGPPPEEGNAGVKRRRESLTQEDVISPDLDQFDKVRTTATSQHGTRKPGKSGKHGKQKDPVSIKQQNSSAKKRKGSTSKRQKKKERKKKRTSERGDDSDDDQRSHGNQKRKSRHPKHGHKQERNGGGNFVEKAAESVTRFLKAAESVSGMLKTVNSFFQDESDPPEKVEEKDSLCPLKLGRKLDEFYENEVEVPDEDIDEAKVIVQKFLDDIWPSIKRITEGVEFEEYSIVGSISEGLTAMEIHDFDIQLLIKIDSSKLTAVDIPAVPGYKNIECSTCDHNTVTAQGRSLLSPGEVLKKIQSIVQRMVNREEFGKHNNCSYRPGIKGPTIAIEIGCSHDDQNEVDWIRVEFVPLITTSNGENFVAKPANQIPSLHHPQAWRHSFAVSEREFINGKSDDDLRVLKLMKAITSHKDRSLSVLSSYFLKNIYCHLDRGSYIWQSHTLCDQFVVFLEKAEMFAEQQDLPNCFSQEKINLFFFQNLDTVKNLRGRLQTIKSDIPKFLRKLLNIKDHAHDEF